MRVKFLLEEQTRRSIHHLRQRSGLASLVWIGRIVEANMVHVGLGLVVQMLADLNLVMTKVRRLKKPSSVIY